jgi:hypothetical protein
VPLLDIHTGGDEIMTAVTFVAHVEEPSRSDTVPISVFPRDAAHTAGNELDHFTSAAGHHWQRDADMLLDTNGWERIETWRPSDIEGVYTAAGQTKP